MGLKFFGFNEYITNVPENKNGNDKKCCHGGYILSKKSIVLKQIAKRSIPVPVRIIASNIDKFLNLYTGGVDLFYIFCMKRVRKKPCNAAMVHFHKG